MTDPLRPCARCISKKVKCSLMPYNEKTGKADRSKLSAEYIRKYRIEQLNKGKGKKRARGQRGDEAPGSGPSPSGMPSTLEPGNGSHSPSSQGTQIQSASFCIEVPAPRKKSSRYALVSPAAAAAAPSSITPATASTPGTRAQAAAAATATTAATAPAAATAPTAPTAPAAPSTPTITPTPATTAVGLPSSSSITNLPAAGPGSSLGSPALAPALRRLVAPERSKRVPTPSSPGAHSRRQQVDTGAAQSGADGNLADRIRALERRVDELERREEAWKRRVSAMLRD